MDTTAHTLSFAVYALARYPEVQLRCQREVDQWIVSHASSETQLGTLPPYAEAMLKECMRKWPVAGPGSMRQVRQPEGVQLTPTVHVPQDWWILVSLYTIHNSKEAWGADAEEFLPERWLPRDGAPHQTHEEDPLSDPLERDGKASSSEHTPVSEPASKISSVASDNSHLASPSCYAGSGYSSDELCFLPFSFGMRNCVGMNLALMELRITLLGLIAGYHFSLAGNELGAGGEEEDMFETVFTLRPRHGCPIRVAKRE
jgi:cytochrome P450